MYIELKRMMNIVTNAKTRFKRIIIHIALTGSISAWVDWKISYILYLLKDGKKNE